MNNIQCYNYNTLKPLYEQALDATDRKTIDAWTWLGYEIELKPLEGTRKSFYKKAYVILSETQAGGFTAKLKSYSTIVARVQYLKDNSVIIHRTVDASALNATTLRHIKAALGLNKAGFLALPLA